MKRETLRMLKKYLQRMIIAKFVPYETAIRRNYLERSNYAYCCLHSALLAKKLGIEEISAIEFGVAKGSGLLALEKICSDVTQITGIKFQIYGFDTGKGLPEPKSYKDLPYAWRLGDFAMAKDKLQQKLVSGTLIFGDVKETVTEFIEKYNPAPIGCMFHDLDFYSSTKDSFSFINQANQLHFLPRVFNYFDDILGNELELYSEFTGERLAIEEFNSENTSIKFAELKFLLSYSRTQMWYHQLRALHFFEHPLYNNYIG